MFEPQVDDLRNSETRKACAQLGSRIRYGQPPVDRHRNQFFRAPELPVEGAPSRWVDGADALLRVGRAVCG